MWQDLRYEDAVKAWETIPDEILKARFLAAVESYERIMRESALYSDISLMEITEQSWNSLTDLLADFLDIPEELWNEPYRQRLADLQASLGTLAEKLYPEIIKQRGISEAYSFIDHGYTITGRVNRTLATILSKLKNDISAKKKLEEQAAKLYADATGILKQLDYSSTFMEKITTYDRAIDRMTEARSMYLESESVYGTDAALKQEIVRIKNSIADTIMAKEKLVREASVSLYKILSEIFSRLPEDSDLQKMGKEALVSFYTGKITEIRESIAEIEKLAREFPTVIDRGKLRQFQKDADGFASRVNRILTALANEEQLRAQRGNMAFPLIIGLFNPTANDPKKSRPATIVGTTSGSTADWWWGNAEVDDENLYKLEIRMNDSRTIRAFPESFKNRTVNVDRNLITTRNTRYNTWSIDDVGFKLNRNGEYYLQITAQSQGSQSYNAEIVLYEDIVNP